MLYPYLAGYHAIEGKLSEAQSIEFGAALKRLHTTEFPAAITQALPRESFSPRWREELATFLRANASETLELVNRAEHFARDLER